MTIQWLGQAARFGEGFLGQVPSTIVSQVQEALNREFAARGLGTRVAVTGQVDQATCSALRSVGGNPTDFGLASLVNSWGSQLQAACAALPGAPVATAYPWNAQSAATRALQGAINAALSARSLCAIDVDGVLGPQTCEAGQYLEQQGVLVAGWPQARSSCRSFDSAWVPNPPCAGAVVEPPPAVPECPAGQSAVFNTDTGAFECAPAAPGAPAVRAAGMGTGGIAALALLAALAAAYFFAQT